VLIPSPNVAEDHQTKNAQAFSHKDAAILLAEKDLENLPNVIDELLADETKRQTLARQIKKLARPHATAHIVDTILEDLSKQ